MGRTMENPLDSRSKSPQSISENEYSFLNALTPSGRYFYFTGYELEGNNFKSSHRGRGFSNIPQEINIGKEGYRQKQVVALET